MKTVGVVIPIYNVEKYLRECLDSVVNQTYKNLQVVLVNDGSTDENSLNIAKEYTLKDERFILFDKENGGLSSSRNVGIEFFSKEYDFKNITQELKENSLVEFKLDNEDNPYNIYKIYKSSNFFKNKDELLNFKAPDIDYIIFLDSDDYWELNCIEECVPRMNGVEVVWFDFQVFDQNNQFSYKWSRIQAFGYSTNLIISPYEWAIQSKKMNQAEFAFGWGGMINFSYLKKINLKFINGIIWEDVHFGTLLFSQASNIYVLCKKIYNYRIHEKSISAHQAITHDNISLFILKKYSTYFNSIVKLREYHSIISRVTTSKEIIIFIQELKNKKLKKKLEESFYNYLVQWNEEILTITNDPENCFLNMHLIEKNLDDAKLLSQSSLINFKNWIVLKINNLQSTILGLNQTLEIKNQELGNQTNQIHNLNTILENKNQLLIAKQNLLNFQNNYGKAKTRIQNQLSYKLGQALIINSKSVLGYLSLPFIILSIVISHKQEQKAYKFKIKKNPNLALPSLETYPDYNEALKEKECFTYKLGEAFIKASKNWYGGGVYQIYTQRCA
ncbi:glycosyltransferase family 2 protein [Campylobacter jejuni]|nr:glycosyltransferase family 2 protein [Campylobacter jejuni]EGB0869831.1 glycosyltransferase family 2 protein [Campylobacter jejuni]EIF7501509.1 glycosyltransferase family 2 protein [Campylobacter jejuni]EIY8494896.1 glycosyltransferase family 2 protein [Campylobacter jejuni]ELD9149515.1 glycosyltransferase family 2 protein [Campylobacter jejuni]